MKITATSVRRRVPVLFLGAIACVCSVAPHSAIARDFSLPLTTAADNKVDQGAFAGGSTVTLSVSGNGDVIDARWQVKPDGSLAAPASGTYSYANQGAPYSTQDGGDGVNHFSGGGANFDSTGSGYGFAGKQTTDTTDAAAIRLGAVVGTFSSTPTRADWFLVGNGGSFQVPANGAHLFVAVNDSLSSDNHGSYTGTVSGSAPSCVPAPGGLVSEYSAEGNALDSVGSNNGTLTNGTTFAAGEVGQAFNFNSSASNHVRIPDSASLKVNRLTIEAWINFNATNLGHAQHVFGKAVGTSNYNSYELWYQDGALHGMTGAANDFTKIDYGWQPAVGTWHPVAYTFDGSSHSLYIDGAQVATAPNTRTPEYDAHDVLIGGDLPGDANSTPIDFFEGKIDEVSLYSRALSPGEIQSIYNAGSGGKCAGNGGSGCVAPPSGLSAQFPGEGNATDSIGGDNGTPQNGATFAAGIVGSAFSLDGADDYVRVPNSSTLNPRGSFTIEGWIFPTSDSGGYIMTKWGDAGGYDSQRSYILGTEPGLSVSFAISDAANQGNNALHTFISPGGVITLNAWNHVAGVYDQKSGERRIYVNGVQVAARTDAPLTVTASSADVSIGANLNTPNSARNFFAGKIDELSFYNRPLSLSEIRSIFGAGSSGKCGAPAHGGLSETTFQLNESTDPPSFVDDTVLRFRATQFGRAAGLKVRVQSSTNYSVSNPANATWTNLPDATGGLMSFVAQFGGYSLNTTNYPAENGVFFRAVASGPGYGESASNVIGPCNLTSTKPHIGGPLLFVTTNGEVNAIRFGVKQNDLPSGVGVRIQTSQTPADEGSWSDAPIGSAGHMTQDMTTPDAHQFYLGTDDYPSGEGVYFRAAVSAPGYVDSLSFAYGPFTFVSDPAANVSISVDDVAVPEGNSIDDGRLLPNGSFSMQANASSGRFIKRLTLLYDGVTIGHFDDGATSGAINNYRTNIPGDHIIEAYATDDLGVTGAAPPVHVRMLPAAPGRIFEMTQSGEWNNAANWIDISGGPGVPGPNDFAIVGSLHANLPTDVTVNAVSLNGGTISGAHTLTVTAFCTIGGGRITSNLTIPSGSTCEFLNDDDVQLTGTLNYAGTVRLHGKGGITGIKSGTSHAAAIMRVGERPDGFFDGLLGAIKGVGKFFADLASGGRRGSKGKAPNPPAPAAPERRTVQVATLNISAGLVSSAPAPQKLISQDGAGIIVSHDGGGLIGQDGAGLVASGGGNLVASGGGNVVSHDGGGLVASGGGNLVASGGGNLVATGGGNLVASGGGNLVASGGGNFHGPTNAFGAVQSSAAAAEATEADYNQTGGETDLSLLSITGSVELAGGVLSGSGFIFGDLTNDGGFITPGHSAGALAVVGNFTQTANGTMTLEVGGPQTTQFDQLHVTGNAALGGNLIVNTINGYTPDAADTFNPLEYTSASGGFASISGNAQLTFNADGAIASVNPAVANPPAPKLLNIATRMRVEQGDQALIAGFIITGSAPKKVLIRGIGPSLGNVGVADPLQDPTLELNNPDGSSEFNDNWRDTQEAEVNASTIPPSDNRESAIVATLQPGQLYTAVLRGNGDTAGVGSVEVYDLSADADAQLANISTRGFVQTGDNVMIGGFIVAGQTPSKVIVRAIGPSLAAVGVSGALADPTLDVVDADGNTIASDDDWRNTQEADIAASGIAPSNDREAAILTTLTPGAYTAIVRGKENTSGIGLVEAYNVQ